MAILRTNSENRLMERIRSKRRQWPCLQFSRLDVKKPEEIAEFIIWLCTGHIPDWSPHHIGAEIDEEDLTETLWGWDNAPRHRMAKLLWQLLVQNNSHEFFSQYFTLDQVWLTRQ